MEFEAEWLLLLPILFGLGWWAARVENRKQMARMRQLPKAYFKSLNYLLDNQHDQAIDALIEVTREDTGSVDLYFSLGHLFAQRGEIARAIRVYQNLLARDDLVDAARHNATYKLGLVFLQGGLFDRAETCFTTLRNSPMHEVALQQLLHIYQSQQEWESAIDVAAHMQQTPQIVLTRMHFNCERAQLALTQKDLPNAERAIDAALAIQANSIRAQLLKARWLLLQNRAKESRALLLKLGEEQPAALPLMTGELMAAFEALNEAQTGTAYLYAQAQSSGSVDVLNAWIEAQDKYGEPSQTEALLYALFTLHPSLNALDKVLKKRLSTSTDLLAKQEYQAIQGLIKKQVLQFSRYRCASCGFEAARYYWQCPACTGWETYPAKRLEELEQAKRSRGQVNGY